MLSLRLTDTELPPPSNVAGGFLWSNNAHISNVNECLESGYYVASHNSKGLPVEVGECPLIVFKISAQSAVQFIAYNNELYVRIYWTGSFLGWRKFIGTGVLEQK